MKKAKKTKQKQGRPGARRAKGTGSLEKHGRVWRAVWKVDGKTFRRSTGQSDQDLARLKLEEFIAPYRLKTVAGKDAKAAKAAGRAGLTATAKALVESAKAKRMESGRLSVPLSKAWETFNASLSRKAVSKSTARTYEGRWECFSEWMEKNRPNAEGLSDVDADAAEAFMRYVKKQFSPKTFNDYRALLLMVWKVLDKPAGLDGANPWKDIATLDKETHVRRELTVEELARAVEPLQGEMRVLFAIGIYTGLRLGDAVTLDWGAVDLARGFIQWTPRKTAKHGTLVRIPLFPALASILAETPARKRKGGILPALAEEYRKHNQRFSEQVRQVFEAAGIETQSETGRSRKAVEVGFHSLRHTFVSLCANAGVPLHIVQAIVGHTNEAMTRHYFHVSDTALQGAVAVLPNVFTPAALPAPKVEGESDTDGAPVEDENAFEAVPAKVAKVARMLANATPEELAKVEKFIEKTVSKGGAA